MPEKLPPMGGFSQGSDFWDRALVQFEQQQNRVVGGDTTPANQRGANLLAALNGAAQIEEVRPGSGAGARILGLHQRQISELRARVGRVEATK